MKLPADASPFPTLGDARQYLEAAGIGDFFARGGSIALANALYRLIGPDPERARTALRLLSLVERGLSDGVEVRFAEFADGVHIWARQDRSAWCSVGEGETLAEAVDNAERRDEL